MTYGVMMIEGLRCFVGEGILVESIKEFEETCEEVRVLRDIEVEKVFRQMRNAMDQDEESGRQVRR